jgi:hypothetical protein
MIGSTGTLIAFVPANRGLVVAGDTRSTIMGHRCDGYSKITIPKYPPLSVVAAAGTSTWIMARTPLWGHDPCGDIAKNGVAFFNSKDIATKYIEENSRAIWEIDLTDFANHIAAKIKQVAETNGEYVRAFAGKTMFLTAFGAYNSATETSYVRAVQFNLTEKFAIEAKFVSDYRFGLNDGPGYLHFGDTVTFTQQVMLGAGKEFIPISLAALESKAKIEEIGIDLASDVAINLIEAAKKASVNIPELRSIGGQVDAYVLEASGARKLN